MDTVDEEITQYIDVYLTMGADIISMWIVKRRRKNHVRISAIMIEMVNWCLGV